ncbi:MAG: aromatic amino acid transaminase [Rhodobacteraceae bacterium]|jgi:aromatic-amino-acid transaminase|nr:aromatic amino acid transaminase [Paracoccaceae bacterium]
MLSSVPAREADAIIRLMQVFRDDPRPGKIDLGVGVWRDAAGRTPVMRAVKAAERRLVETQETKTYTALAGDPAFHAALAGLLFGPGFDLATMAAAATPGGTGAVRQILELVRLADPATTVWISEPTWPNHPAIIATLGLPVRRYRHLDPATGGIDRAGMLADLARARRGEVVLLHGACHNPTGADPDIALWEEIAALLSSSGAVPFVDMAYQGFGAGLAADAAGLRLLAARLPEVLVAASCSKNFGIYRERAGLALALSPDAGTRARVAGTLAWLNRQNFAFPPDHGARVVTEILGDPGLRADWEAELTAMREGMSTNRRAFADALRAATRSDRFGFLAAGRGMFALLGLGPAEVERLRVGYGIYMVGDSRVNVAGLTPDTIPVVAAAVARVATAG